VQPDGSLTATIFDRNGNWTGATTAPHLVSVNTWHTAEIQHDGINTVEIFLDGALVGSAYDALGPVASVGPHGIAIGHWPEVSGQYTFSGFIREVKLYKYDPYKDANGLLDHCCVDRKALDDAAVQLRRRGATADSLEAKGREILQFGYDMLAQVRGNDQAVTLKQRQISAQALSAFEKRDQTSYTTSLAQLATLAQSCLSASQMASLHERQDDLIKSLPLPFEQLSALVGSVCWDKVGVDPATLVAAMQHLSSKARGQNQG
jgi:hypothetical protein